MWVHKRNATHADRIPFCKETRGAVSYPSIVGALIPSWGVELYRGVGRIMSRNKQVAMYGYDEQVIF